MCWHLFEISFKTLIMCISFFLLVLINKRLEIIICSVYSVILFSCGRFLIVVVSNFGFWMLINNFSMFKCLTDALVSVVLGCHSIMSLCGLFVVI